MNSVNNQKIMFLWGMNSGPGGTKSTRLKAAGFSIFEPDSLSYPSSKREKLSLLFGKTCLANCVKKAQQFYDKIRPNVVIGSSLGGVTAMNMNTGSTPLMLIAPAWRWRGFYIGKTRTVPPNTIIIHSPYDKTIKYTYSKTLLQYSRKNWSKQECSINDNLADKLREQGYHVEENTLIAIGKDHGCNEADLQDSLNKNPDPAVAMAYIVNLLLQDNQCQ